MQSLLDRIARLEDKLSAQPKTDRFRLLVESAPNGMILTDEGGEIIMVNQRVERMFGYDREELVGMKIEQLIPPRFRKNHGKYREKFHGAPEVRAMGVGRELFALRSDGSEFPVEVGLNPIHDETGTMILSAILDITERKKAYAKVEFQSEILRNVHDAVFYLRPDGQILEWNEGAERVFGISQEAAIGGNLFSFLTEGSERVFPERLFPLLDRDGSAEKVLRCFLTNGRDLFIRAKATRLRQNNLDGYVICASDITEQKRLEAKIISISENEQKRIGQDIHDDLCSQLSGIACITKALETQFLNDQRQHAEMMARISEMVAEAVTKARQIAKGLVPAALETQGLKGALEDLVENHREMFGSQCRITSCDPEATRDLPSSVGTQLYRIAQEAITNAVKHSEAATIDLNLKSTGDDEIELKIIDNGKGISADPVSVGLGLLTMQQRAEMIGADFDIHSSPDSGTTICVSLPKPIRFE